MHLQKTFTGRKSIYLTPNFEEVINMARVIKASQLSRSGEVVLWENEINGIKEYELIINGVFIMASYNHLSSELLVRNAIRPGQNTEILVGGLGMGYTVKEACAHTEVVGVDVIEIEPVIIEWNRTWFKKGNNACLDDQRVKVMEDDFFSYVQNCEKTYDLIGMDIDNGPMMLVNDTNARVYRAGFFRQILSLLNHEGVFAIWSCNHDENLLQEARLVFPDCQAEEVIEEHDGRKVPYYIYFCRKK
jgi:spermidine synthase